MTEHETQPFKKGCEHDKWKAMVDSVIEFLSASRTMLHVLNERILEREKLKLAETKMVGNEKTKLEIYKERLCSPIGTTVNEDGDVQPHKDKVECTVHKRVKGSGDKAEKQTSYRRSKSTGRIRERSPKLHSDGSQTYEGLKLDKGSETNLEHVIMESQISASELTAVVEEDAQSTSEQKLSKTSAEGPNFEVGRAHQSGGALSKLPRASRIPRTKSFNEDKSKYSLVDKTQNEQVKRDKVKKGQKDITYSKLHQRVKNSKGDFFKVE